MIYHLDRNVEPLESLESLGNRDILVALPSYNSKHAIRRVVEIIGEGLERFFPGHTAIIMDSDGWSTDGTREEFESAKVPERIDKLVSLYSGISGKGSAIRNIIDVARQLEVKACMIVDSDLRSITPDWVRYLLEPVIKDVLDYVFPLYTRHKYDATITKHFMYPLMRAFYGYEIRQPIGGDVGFSRNVIELLSGKKAWEIEDISRYGIDVWMTIQVIIHDMRMGQAALGVKIHDSKDPVLVLAPMFRQIIGTCFEMAGRHVDCWIDKRQIKELPMIGQMTEHEPEPIQADYEGLINRFNEFYSKHLQIWEKFLYTPSCEYLKSLKKSVDEQRLYIANSDWARLVYDFFIAYNKNKEFKNEMLESMTSLYYIIIVDFMNKAMNKDTRESMRLVHEQAEAFVTEKDYLVKRWKSTFSMQ